MNRLSFGIESFHPHVLKRLGRLQTAAETRLAVAMAREAGFANVSLDLMFAVPGQSVADWRTDLDTAISHAPEHISAYNLTYEEGTPFFDLKRAGRLDPLEDEIEAAMFEEARESPGERRLPGVRSLELRPARLRSAAQPELLARRTLPGNRRGGAFPRAARRAARVAGRTKRTRLSTRVARSEAAGRRPPRDARAEEDGRRVRVPPPAYERRSWRGSVSCPVRIAARGDVPRDGAIARRWAPRAACRPTFGALPARASASPTRCSRPSCRAATGYGRRICRWPVAGADGC